MLIIVIVYGTQQTHILQPPVWWHICNVFSAGYVAFNANGVKLFGVYYCILLTLKCSSLMVPDASRNFIIHNVCNFVYLRRRLNFELDTDTRTDMA